MIYHYIIAFYIDVPAQTVTYDFEAHVSPGDVLKFVCETLNSPILAWSSDEYVGEGGILLEFLSIDRNGTVKRSTSNPNTSAVLTRSFERNGVNVIISNLTITVSSDIDRHGHNITCINVGIGTRNTTTIRLSGKPCVVPFLMTTASCLSALYDKSYR